MPTSVPFQQMQAAYTAATRGAGASAPASPDQIALIHGAGWPLDVPTIAWRGVDITRFTLLNDFAATVSADTFAAAARACFDQGDAGEQASWCRAVSLLPHPEQYLAMVIDACRTNIVPLFESIACENPYPAAFFPERNFNQVVLKAMFNGIALARIAGLAGRRNPELARMATDYAAERTAAGRTVPADIGLAL